MRRWISTASDFREVVLYIIVSTRLESREMVVRRSRRTLRCGQFSPRIGLKIVPGIFVGLVLVHDDTVTNSAPPRNWTPLALLGLITPRAIDRRVPPRADFLPSGNQCTMTDAEVRTLVFFLRSSPLSKCRRLSSSIAQSISVSG